MYNPTKPYKDDLLQIIKSTWQSPYLEIEEGTYSIFRKKFDFFEVDHTDGIGSKGFYHWQQRTFKEVVLDALAMNLNDLALVRAIPYKLQNHLTLPTDDHSAIKEIITALAAECCRWQIAITGGETSIHETSDSLDLSLTVSGFIKERKPNRFQIGDVLIGLPSSGLHSNGFTKVRDLFGPQIRSEFTEPTAIYLKTILALNEKIDLHGLMHITGGAFTKLKDLLTSSDAVIDHSSLPLPNIFKDIHQRGVRDEDMYRTFNCGVGFVFSVSPTEVPQSVKLSKGKVIGQVVKGHGKIRIDSYFSSKKIVL